MFKDDKPTNAANDAANLVPIIAPDDEWVNIRAHDELFEDVLDIEGPMRVAMTAVAGFSSPGLDEFERGIAVLDGRIPDAACSRLRAEAAVLRATVDAGDAAGVRSAQAAIVDNLASL
ncbi:MAG TPA: hypothetical protein VMQ93_12510, partial [Novosphingobium sp.]|nr:hypothetical protein [Novosphingobium sp.]